MKAALLGAGVMLFGLLALGAGEPARAQSAAACAGRGLPESGLSEGALTVDGVERSFLVYTPVGLDTAQPVPVVFSLHGFTSNARQQMGLTGWNSVADEGGFLVVYPQGLGRLPRWNAGRLGARNPGSMDDTGFLRTLAAYVTETLCTDPTRLFVNGMSNGGGMTYRLACEAADVFAAFGGVAGAYSDSLDCAPARPVPMLFFHGTADPIVPFEGARGMPNVPAFVEAFAGRTGCPAVPEPLPTVGDTTGVLYGNCDGGAEVGLYVIEEGGHTWPGGFGLADFLLGKTTQDISASALLWDFYQAHPLADGE